MKITISVEPETNKELNSLELSVRKTIVQDNLNKDISLTHVKCNFKKTFSVGTNTTLYLQTSLTQLLLDTEGEPL